MSLRASVTDRALDLPPLFKLVTLREVGDAHAHGCRVAGEHGAGTLVWVRRFDVAEFAVVLEPEEPLAEARRAFLVGMNALADTLTGFAPPTMGISFDWPDGLRIDGVLVGGGRLGWPDCAEEDVPDWLVFSATIRTAVIRASDPGMRPLLGALDEMGFEAIDAGEIVAGFARHLMAGFHDWAEEGFGAIEERYFSRMAGVPPLSRATGEGDHAQHGGGGNPDPQHVPSPPPPASPVPLPRFAGEEPGAGLVADRSEPERLREALLAPSWRDPGTGMPWL